MLTHYLNKQNRHERRSEASRTMRITVFRKYNRRVDSADFSTPQLEKIARKCRKLWGDGTLRQTTLFRYEWVQGEIEKNAAG